MAENNEQTEILELEKFEVKVIAGPSSRRAKRHAMLKLVQQFPEIVEKMAETIKEDLCPRKMKS